MVVKLLKSWLGQSIGDEVNVPAVVGEQMIAQNIATIIDPNEYPIVKKLSVELVRPATTTTYDAGDAILGTVTAVKQKWTLTLSGTFGSAVISDVGGLSKTIDFSTSLTLTAAGFVTDNAADYLAEGVTLTSDGADLIFEAVTEGNPIAKPVITNPTSDMAGTVHHNTANRAAVKQKETITLAGEYGSCVISAVGGLSKTVTFDTDLGTTAGNFVTANAAEYLTKGIVLTSNVADLIFEANVAGVGFTAPLISGVAGDFSGIVTHAVANREAVAQVDTVTITGENGTALVTGIGGLSKIMDFDTSLKITADAFVTNHAAAYDAAGVTVTAGETDTLIFTSKVAGTPLVAAVVTNQTGNLAGTNAVSTENVTAVKQVESIAVSGVSGYAVIALTGELTKYLTYATSVAASINAFITANAALYLAQGVVLSRDNANLVMTANVAGAGFVAPTITNVPGVRGTVDHTTANVTAIRQMEEILISGTFGQATIAAAGGLSKVITFNGSLTTTLVDFVTTNIALYDAQGIMITSAGNSLRFYAKVTGTGFTAPTITVKANLSGVAVQTTANTSLSALKFIGAAKQKGAGGKLLMVKVATNMTMFAGKTIRLWFSASEPTLIVGDNIAYVSKYANAGASDFYVDVKFDALLANSDMVYGVALPAQPMPFSTADKTLYCLVQSVDGAETPTSEGKILFNAYFER
jgi:hypothetical protein